MLNSWDKRSLSLIGKTLVVKSLAMSQVLYLVSVIPNPNDKLQKELENILFKYLWNNKPDKIKRKYVIARTTDGGLGFPHIKTQFTALKCAWIKRLVSGSPALWKQLVILSLPCQDRYMWHCNLNVNDVPDVFVKLKSVFWKVLIESWCQYIYHVPNTRKKNFKTNNLDEFSY